MTITPLKVVGNQLRDQSGSVVQLRGTNNIGADYSCLTNQSPVDPVFGGVPTDAASLVIMHDIWGCNCCRVSLNVGCWLNDFGTPYTFGAIYQQAILAYIDRINAAGMYCIIDVSNASNISKEMADITVVNFWNSITPMLVNRPLVLLEPYNEPHTILLWATWLNGGVNPEGLSYTVYGMQQLVNTIRAAGSIHILLLDGLSFAGDFTGLPASMPTDSLGQLGLSWHRYSDNPHTSATDIGDVYSTHIAALSKTYPITMTEFGGIGSGTPNLDILAFNQQYYMAHLHFCDYYGIGYLNYAWSRGPGINILSDYTTYQPSEYGTPYYQHLRLKAAGGVTSQRDTRQAVTPTLPW